MRALSATAEPGINRRSSRGGHIMAKNHPFPAAWARESSFSVVVPSGASIVRTIVGASGERGPLAP